MSGGRATVAKGAVRQAGDITAVAPEGHILTDHLYIECKHLKSISLDGLIKGNGTLLAIWLKTGVEALKYNKHPVLIFRQNNYPVVFCTNNAGLKYLQLPKNLVRVSAYTLHMMRFDELTKTQFPLIAK